jgi:hypothetical protein
VGNGVGGAELTESLVPLVFRFGPRYMDSDRFERDHLPHSDTRGSWSALRLPCLPSSTSTRSHEDLHCRSIHWRQHHWCCADFLTATNHASRLRTVSRTYSCPSVATPRLTTIRFVDRGIRTSVDSGNGKVTVLEHPTTFSRTSKKRLECSPPNFTPNSHRILSTSLSSKAITSTTPRSVSSTTKNMKRVPWPLLNLLQRSGRSNWSGASHQPSPAYPASLNAGVHRTDRAFHGLQLREARRLSIHWEVLRSLPSRSGWIDDH